MEDHKPSNENDQQAEDKNVAYQQYLKSLLGMYKYKGTNPELGNGEEPEPKEPRP